MKQHDFGVVTACHASDYCMVKATCASIRHFCGDVPICVIADGRFSTDELVRIYGVQVLRVPDLKNPLLRSLCSGSGRAKLAAMWEGPFERYVYLDGDAIFWGNVLHLFGDLTRCDFFVCRPCDWKDFSVETVRQVYLEPDSLALFDPEFSWRGKPLFCTGAFASRRNLVPLKRWLEVEDWERNRPGTFKLYDQGMLNYVVFKLADEERIRYEEVFVHVTTGDRSTEEMEQRFPCDIDSPPEAIERPWILHFCGKKPLLQYPKSYQRPFLAFRLLHYRNLYGNGRTGRLAAWAAVLQDEATVLRRRVTRKLKRFRASYLSGRAAGVFGGPGGISSGGKPGKES